VGRERPKRSFTAAARSEPARHPVPELPVSWMVPAGAALLASVRGMCVGGWLLRKHAHHGAGSRWSRHHVMGSLYRDAADRIDEMLGQS